MNKKLYFVLLFTLFLIGCEPDDICLAETPGTPQIILTFFDKTNPEIKKKVTDLQIKGVDNERIAYSGTSDSIAIALKTASLTTSFIFTTTTSNTSYSDTLTLNYDSHDIFISRACGFKTTYSNLTIKQSNPINWITSIEIINNTISDINTSHVKILH